MRRHTSLALVVVALTHTSLAAFAQEASAADVDSAAAPEAAAAEAPTPEAAAPAAPEKTPPRAVGAAAAARAERPVEVSQPLYCYPTPMERPVRADGVHEHKGLFVRATLALAAEVGKPSASDLASTDDVRYEGATREWTLAVGGALSRNFVLYGEYMNTKLIDDEDRDDWSAHASGLGVGFVYYLPRVLFFSASGFFEQISVDVGDTELLRNRLAAAVALKVGAEFWAAKQIGIGGYVGLHTASTSHFDASTEEGWTTRSMSFGISAVYN